MSSMYSTISICVEEQSPKKNKERQLREPCGVGVLSSIYAAQKSSAANSGIVNTDSSVEMKT